ncbi:MAG TPA: protoporphyrinogen oxidase HemJ [Flavobacteriales bacterium]|nr:protoporphyrinogen oxidase HemJ [Flavobacteriales bacterium]
MGLDMFLWIKAIHIISVIAWMAGLLYLPRLFVYHSDKEIEQNTSNTFKVMERKLYRFIMNPSVALVWITGLILFYYSGIETWLLVKIALVILMTFFHIFLGQRLRDFSADANKYPSRFFRIINEVPTIIMIIIVFLAVLQP